MAEDKKTGQKGAGAKSWPAGAQNVGAGSIGKGGTPLPDSLREGMEKLMGADFSDVRILNNSCVPKNVGANAFTNGTDIHFAAGQYNPATPAGQRLLAHELTHVVQQAEARVKPKL